MIKSIVSVIVVSIIIVIGAIFESNFINRQFDEYHEVLLVCFDKIEKEVATSDDIIAVQKNWLDKKKYLHIFIPHNEIKEMDLWISEAITLVKDKEWSDAKSKIQVLINLSEQIPNTFKISIENIF